MTADVQQLLLRIEASTELARRELDRAGGAVDQLGRRAEAVQGQFDKAFRAIDVAANLAKGAIAGFVGSLSVGAVTRFARSILQFADDLGTAADQAGIGVERFQTLKEGLRALELTGAQTQTVFARLQDALGNVQGGTATPQLLRTLERLGALQGILNGEISNTEQLFDAVARGAGRYESQARLVADITDLVGRQAGPAFAAAIRDGGAALRAAEQAQRDFGTVVSAEVIARLADANETIDRFTTQTRNQFVIWAADVVSSLERVAGGIDALLDGPIRRLNALPAADAGRNLASVVGLLRSAPGFGAVAAGAAALSGPFDEGAERVRREQLADLVNRRFPLSQFGLKPAPVPIEPPARGRGGAGGRTRAASGPAFRDRFDGRSAAQFRLDRLNIDSPPPFFEPSLLREVNVEVERIAEQLEQINLANAEIAREPFFRSRELFIVAGFAEDIAQSIGAAVAFGRSLGDALENSFRRAGAALIASGITRLLGAGLNSVLPGFGSLFGGFFASGGRPPLGRVSVVGERGPELFVPDVPGTIIPNSRIGGLGGSVVVNVDARGAMDPVAVEQAAARAVLAAAPMLVSAAKAETLGTLRRPALPGGRR